MASRMLITVLFVVLMSLLVGPAQGETLHPGGIYTGSSTWSLEDGDHIVTGNIIIGASGSITIEPGCVVKFENYMGISVNGILDAKGTTSDGILFTRRDADDSWNGLSYQSGSSGDLSYCTFEYSSAYSTGSGIYADTDLPQIENCTFSKNNYGISGKNLTSASLLVGNSFVDNYMAGIHFDNCSGVNLANQSLSGNMGIYGAIYLTSCGPFHLGSGNTVLGNSWALTMDLGSYPDLTSAGNIPIAGNVNDDGIRVRGYFSDGYSIWHNLGVNFIVTGSPQILAGDSLTIEPGCIVQLENNSSLIIFGALDATGTPVEEILFTRRNSDGGWNGLQFKEGSNADISYCTFEYSTAYGTGSGIYADTDLPQIENCSFNNNNYGITGKNLTSVYLLVGNSFIGNDIAGIHFENCSGVNLANQSFSGNTGIYGAIYLTSCGSFHFGSGNVALGNSWALTIDLGSYPDLTSLGNIPIAGNINDDGIQVSGHYSSGHSIWYNLGVPYIVTSSPQILDGDLLSIEPGCVVMLENLSSLTIYGTLNAQGSSAERILFTRRQADGNWKGLNYQSGSSGDLSYCTIEHSTAYGAASGVYINNADLLFEACTFKNNTCGLSIVDSSPSLVNCSIINNIQYGMYISGNSVPAFGSTLEQWNNIYGNGSGNSDCDLHNGSADIEAKFVYWGSTNEVVVEDLIHHRVDDGVLGLVTFSPWTNLEHDQEYESGATPVDDYLDNGLPHMFGLAQNYPNPFNPATTIDYDLPHECQVKISVYDVCGRLVEILVDQVESAGRKSIIWQSEGRGSGVYLCSVEAGEFKQVRKMVLVQ